MSSGFPIKKRLKPVSLATVTSLKFRLLQPSLDIIFSNKRITKGTDQTADVHAGLSLCCSQASEDRFSRVEAHMVLKECSTQISPILALIYNESLAQGNVPDDWRHANVSPVFKKGQQYDAANYRPMSLTCICCKTLEHILVSNINKHLA